MEIEKELTAAHEAALNAAARCVSLEAALLEMEGELTDLLAGKTKEIPAHEGTGAPVFSKLHDLSVRYAERERAMRYVPSAQDDSAAAQWQLYGQRLARTGSPEHAAGFLWKAFYGTFPASYRVWGRLLLYTGRSAFGFAGEKLRRLDVASDLVPVLSALHDKRRADRLSAQMLQLVAECRDLPLVRHGHVALSRMYEGLKNERFAAYHRERSQEP